jgi:hypothetical protein
MMKLSPVSLPFAMIVVLALAYTPNLVLAQHRGHGSHGSSRGGSHGGGHSHAGGGGHSFHGGGFHGGGGSRARSYYNGSHKGGQTHASGSGRSSRGNGAFHGSSPSHGSSGGHYIGGNSRGRMPAGPTQRSNGVPKTALTFGHSTGPSSSRQSGTRGSSIGDGQWHSFGSRENSSTTAARGPSTAISDGQWHSFGGHGNSSATAARGTSNSWQGGATRTWNGQGHQMFANKFGSPAFARSAAPSWSSSSGLTGSNPRFGERSSRSTGSAISTSRVVSNIDHSQFGNSATNRFSFLKSPFGSHVSRFERPEFGGRHEFRGGASHFGFRQESSFGGDAFSFFPNLLGLALAFGSFGSRGFGFPGLGLLGLGLNLLQSGIGDFGGDSGYGGDGDYGSYGGYVGNGGYAVGALYGACVGSGWTPVPVTPYYLTPGVVSYPIQYFTCLQ